MKEVIITDGELVELDTDNMSFFNATQNNHGQEHQFHNPHLYAPDIVQLVLHGYIMPILVAIRLVIFYISVYGKIRLKFNMVA